MLCVYTDRIALYYVHTIFVPTTVQELPHVCFKVSIVAIVTIVSIGTMDTIVSIVTCGLENYLTARTALSPLLCEGPHFYVYDPSFTGRGHPILLGLISRISKKWNPVPWYRVEEKIPFSVVDNVGKAITGEKGATQAVSRNERGPRHHRTCLEEKNVSSPTSDDLPLIMMLCSDRRHHLLHQKYNDIFGKCGGAKETNIRRNLLHGLGRAQEYPQ